MTIQQKQKEFRKIAREFKAINISKVILVVFVITITATSCEKLPLTFYGSVGMMMTLTLVYRYVYIRKGILLLKDHMRFLKRDYVLAHLKEDGMDNDAFEREVLFLFLLNYLTHAYDEVLNENGEEKK